MDSRISRLHNAILDETQQFKMGNVHVKTLTELLTNENLTLADIQSTFETLRGMDKSIFLDASSAAAYDIVLQLDKAIVLRHLAESNSPDSKENIKNDYAKEINRVIQDNITLYKQSLQQKIDADTQHLLTTYNEKVRTLNEKIIQFNEEHSPEVKDAPVISHLIAREKRFAVYQSLHREVKTLEAETFQLADVKLENKSPTLEINALFPEFDAKIISLQEHIKRQQQQKTSILAYEALLVQIEKNLEEYNKRYIDVEYTVTKAFKLGFSAAKSATDAVSNWMPFSQPAKIKVESKASTLAPPKTSAERYSFLNQVLKESPSKLHIKLLSQQDKIEILKAKKLAVEKQLKESLELNFSAENIQRIKDKVIQDQQDKLRQSAKKIIVIALPLVVSEEEWEQALKNESADRLLQMLEHEELDLQQALKGIQNSNKSLSIKNKYAPVIQKLRVKYTEKEAQRQNELRDNRGAQQEEILYPIPPKQSQGNNNQPPLVEDTENSNADEVSISSRSESKSDLTEVSRSSVSSKNISSRSVALQEAKEQPADTSSVWLGRMALAFVFTLFVVGSILTGGVLTGLLTGSYLLYIGMGALGLDVLGGLTYGIKKAWTKCCTAERAVNTGQSCAQPDSSLHRARNDGGGNSDIRRGLCIPPQAPGNVDPAFYAAEVPSVSRHNGSATHYQCVSNHSPRGLTRR
jgi:hypothetical protein